jgi:2',3'-cyclic-nucleotide 2'-phosphodiesterase
VCTACPAGGSLPGRKDEDARAGQESLTVGSWRPTISEVHGLALHGQAVRSIFVFCCVKKSMRVLFVGDIVGSPGRQIVRDRLADVVMQRQVDLVIANGENSASGFGITPRLAEELLNMGIEVLTGGNHSWDRKEILEFLPHEPRLLRPANFPEGNPGTGLYLGTSKNGVNYAVLNLQGRVFMTPIDDPFRKADSELAKIPQDVALVFVDMHAETTSEKIAMGWYLDGRVTAVVGTHTHVATADEHVLTQGTAYITDVGMTGPHGGVIGMDRNGIITKFLNGLPARFEVASGDVQMNCVMIETDDEGPRNAAGRLRASSIERLRFCID